jgi:outer membrane protein OmpA-like peptidoglycan-associated protein
MERPGAILALVALLAAGCAKSPGSGASVSTSPPATPPATTPTPAPAPFTNGELAAELRRQGVATAAAGQTTPSEQIPEIKETARGVVIRLPSALFAFDSFDLDAQARRVVERIAYVLNHPRAASRTVVLEGHTDAIGTAAYNLVLSRQRADTVSRELIGYGVRRDRVTVAAYGETRPVAPNRKPDGTDDPAGRAKNRRVEAIIRN